MGKLLLWFLIVLAVLIVWRIANTRAARREAGRNGAAGASGASGAGRGGAKARPSGTRAPAEAMVQCAHCGVHLPRSEALLVGGRIWCSQEHARLGPDGGR